MSALLSNVSIKSVTVGPASGCSVTGPSVSLYSTPAISANFVSTMAYGLGVFAGLGFNNGGSYPAYSYYSNNLGVSWTSTSSGVNSEYRTTVFGSDRFVGVAGNSATSNRNAVSLDGINWTHYTNLPSSSYWYGLGYGDNKFVAGAYGSSTLATSADGITWTPYATTLPGVDTIAYGNGIWVAAYRLASTMYRSADAISWTAVTPSTSGAGVIFDNGIFLSRDYTVNNQFRTSPDGINWTLRTYPVSGSWTSPRWNGNVWVVWGVISGVGKFYWSPNLITWTEITSITTSAAGGGIAMGNGKFVLYQGSSAASSYVVSC